MRSVSSRVVATTTMRSAVGVMVMSMVERVCSIGITSSPDKVALCRDLGFDAVVDYNAPGTLDEKIAATAPQGIDVYFDNVGGEILDGVLPHLADHGRVVVCGMIANYNHADEPYPVRNLWQFMV